MDITFYLSPGFNLTSMMHFVDAFSALNALDMPPTYRLLYASAEGGMVASQQGPAIDCEEVDLLRSSADIVVVCTALEPEVACGAPLAKHLRYWSRQGNLIIGLDSGAVALADGGLLSDSTCIAPGYASLFAARYPSIAVSNTLYSTEGVVRTCAGGAAALDMALSILEERHTADLVRAVRDLLVAPPLREGAQALTAGTQQPLGKSLPGPLVDAISKMRGALDTALSVPTLASQTKLSQRQLERLFRSYTGRSPNQYYRMLRLDRAREMVTRSARPMPEIAANCGFQSPVHFSRAYKEQFGLPPMRDRMRARAS